MAKQPTKPTPPKRTEKPPVKAEKPTKPAPNGTKTAKSTSAKAAPASQPELPPKPVKKPRPDLAAKIVHLIGEDMAIEEAELTDNASFKEDLGLDEIDVAELLMQAEQEFAVAPFNEEDWESCETVGDFIKLIESRVALKRTAKKA